MKRLVLVALALAASSVVAAQALGSGGGGTGDGVRQFLGPSGEKWNETYEHCGKNELPWKPKHRWKCTRVPKILTGTVTLDEHRQEPCAGTCMNDLHAAVKVRLKRKRFPRNIDPYYEVEYELSDSATMYWTYAGTSDGPCTFTTDEVTTALNRHLTGITGLTFHPGAALYSFGLFPADASGPLRVDCPPAPTEGASYPAPNLVGTDHSDDPPRRITGVDLIIDDDGAGTVHTTKTKWRFTG